MIVSLLCDYQSKCMYTFNIMRQHYVNMPMQNIIISAQNFIAGSL